MDMPLCCCCGDECLTPFFKLLHSMPMRSWYIPESFSSIFASRRPFYCRARSRCLWILLPQYSIVGEANVWVINQDIKLLFINNF